MKIRYGRAEYMVEEPPLQEIQKFYKKVEKV